MAHSRRRRTKCPSISIPIGLDQEQRGVATLLDHETTESPDLLLSQRILRMRISAYRPINIIPQIMSARPSYPIDIITAQQLLVVTLADTCRHTKDQPLLTASLNTTHCPVENLRLPTTTITLLLQSLDTQQGRDISTLAHPPGDLAGQQRPVREQLKIAITMFP